MAGLMARDVEFLLDDDDRQIALPFEQVVRRREPDDACPHDDDVATVGHGRRNLCLAVPFAPPDRPRARRTSTSDFAISACVAHHDHCVAR